MFFLIPTGVDYETRRFPIVTFVIMGLCTAAYVVTLMLSLAHGEVVDDWVFENLWLTPAYSGWWTYLTSMFVHGGFFHLLGNMLYLFLFGCVVEDLIGRVKYVVFYVVAGLGAALTQILASPEHFASDFAFGGASGAITGCIAGFLLLRLHSEIEFKWIFILFFRVWTGDFTLRAWIVIAFWFGKDLLFAMLSATSAESGGGVAFAAHVGGFLCGLSMIGLEKIRERRVAPAGPAPLGEAELARYAAAIVSAPDDFATYHLHLGGEQSGPFSAAQVDSMIQLGSLPEDALFWTEGMDNWRPLADWESR